jgi:hypothetical protein
MEQGYAPEPVQYLLKVLLFIMSSIFIIVKYHKLQLPFQGFKLFKFLGINSCAT